MEFGWNGEFETFRAEVRKFIREVKTPELERELAEPAAAMGSGPALRHVREALEERGWTKMCWPAEFGGEGKSPWYQYILNEELASAGVPGSSGTATMMGPAIMRFGTEEQKAKFLPGIWRGEINCALGYSEPNAGSDLASLQTAAVRDGDDWLINGQKLWTSSAHLASHVWLAARTDPDAPKHRGISVFIVPMNLPGITVRPIYTFSNWRTNEVFFDNVRVPGDSLIGEAGRGWYTIATALDHERVLIGGGAGLAQQYDRFVVYLQEQRPDLLHDPVVRTRLAELKVALHVLRALTMTNATIVARGDTPTMEASMAKIWSSELRYTMSSTMLDLLGRSGALSHGAADAPLDGDAELTYRGSPVLRFGGGTNEIQRNIIAERGFGLPR
jgi:3-oxocholest-4-en-26-oyl-CoA dehydrogenase alpha subunit